MSNSQTIKIGVIGVGYLGEFHIQQLQTIADIKIVGFSDENSKRAKDICEKYDVQFYSNKSDLIELCDGIVIATPTNSHYEIAANILNNDKHVFIEKPITATIKEADHLIELANKKELLIQVGHIERFNPAFILLKEKNMSAQFIEVHRLASFKSRGDDTSVVLDLMIHDIDLLINLIDSPINEIIADGISVISDNIDLANVKLIFKNGCVANLTASRISNKSMRKIRVFEKKLYTSIDLLNKEISEYNAIQNQDNQDFIFNVNKIKVQEQDALACELIYFCDAIFNKDYNNKNVSSAILALDVANQINHIIQNKHNHSK